LNEVKYDLSEEEDQIDINVKCVPCLSENLILQKGKMICLDCESETQSVQLEINPLSNETFSREREEYDESLLCPEHKSLFRISDAVVLGEERKREIHIDCDTDYKVVGEYTYLNFPFNIISEPGTSIGRLPHVDDVCNLDIGIIGRDPVYFGKWRDNQPLMKNLEDLFEFPESKSVSNWYSDYISETYNFLKKSKRIRNNYSIRNWY